MIPRWPLVLGLLAVLALAGGAGAWLWYRGRVRRRQRLASWQELCLRLELAPQPGFVKVAAGQLPDADFRLHDTGSEWLVEIPLQRPLLPPGMVLLTPRARMLRPRIKLRPLAWGATSLPPGVLSWYSDGEEPAGKVEAPQAFLDEAARAAQAHAPLRVEPRRLVQALRVGALLSVNEVREAVRALDATARRWLEVAGKHGLPQVQALPWQPSAFALLSDVLKQHRFWKWLRDLNLGIPLTMTALWVGGDWVFFGVLVVSLWLARRSYRSKPFGIRGFALGALILATTFGAPWFWSRSMGGGTTPSVLSVREAAVLPHRKAEFFRFHDGVLRQELARQGRGPVPVLPKDWKPGELVTVWAVGFPSNLDHHETLGGIAVEPSVMRGNRHAAIKMALQLGFPIHSHAVFLDFTTHPDTVVLRLRLLALLLWGGPNALWLSWVLVQWRRKVREIRRPDRLRLAR
jgi:hypothetical protein